MNIADVEVLENITKLEAHMTADPDTHPVMLAAVRRLLDEIDHQALFRSKVLELLAMHCMSEGEEVTEQAAALMVEIEEEFL
jgi:hypothetical protein